MVGPLPGGRDKAGGVVSAGAALVRDLSQDVPVRSPVAGADGVRENPVGVVVHFRPRGVEEKKSAVVPHEVLDRKH